MRGSNMPMHPSTSSNVFLTHFNFGADSPRGFFLETAERTGGGGGRSRNTGLFHTAIAASLSLSLSLSTLSPSLYSLIRSHSPILPFLSHPPPTMMTSEPSTDPTPAPAEPAQTPPEPAQTPPEPVQTPVEPPASDAVAEVDLKTASVNAVEKNSSFRDESNFSDDVEGKALIELRAKVEEAIIENQLFKKAAATQAEAKTEEEADPAADNDVSLWGVPLLPSRGAESTDVVLLKFLRARDFKVKEAFEMLQNVLRWRKELKIDSVLDEESLGAELGEACFMGGLDREGHPVCYNISGVFQDEALYQKTFGTEEAREKFLRWRAQIMEKGIQKLDFKPGGVASLLQITDLNNMPGPSKKELRTVMKQVVQMLQDNYPEFVARNVFINVPFWYYAINALVSPFLTQRTKSKFVFARPAKVAETLLKYIPAEAFPIRYGGLKRENDTVFSAEEGGVSEVIVKASSTENIEIPVSEAGITTVWDLAVLGWEVNYKEEFVPSDEGEYTIIVQKGKRMGAQDAPIRNSFRSNQPGKIVLTVENNTYWKKKAVYRYKARSS